MNLKAYLAGALLTLFRASLTDGYTLTKKDFENGRKINLANQTLNGEKDPFAAINEHEGGNYQGDIILTPHQLRLVKGEGRALLKLVDYWPSNGQHVNIPYIISDSTFTDNEKAVIARAIEEYKTHTCIRIVPRTGESDYIDIVRTRGCGSNLGKIGGRQILSLAVGCARLVGTPIHEFMHAIGYKHEQSRSDRNNYVTINWDNIIDDKKDQFIICTNCDYQDTPYDYESVMHYGPSYFTNGKGPTITTKNGEVIGQRNGFSKYDIIRLQRLYSCNYCASGWYKHAQSCYKLFTGHKNWWQAEHDCNKRGSHLASIHSDEEQQFVTDLLLTTNSDAWIGGKRQGRHGPNGPSWRWTDGSKWNYWAWLPSEPNDLHGNEDCVHLSKGNGDDLPKGRWNDLHCSRDWLNYVCKYTPKVWCDILSKTKIGGVAIGKPKPATIAYKMPNEDAWIIGVHDHVYMKMVKIRIIGKTKFIWLGSKYARDGQYDISCLTSFEYSCYEGSDTIESSYQVQLVARTNCITIGIYDLIHTIDKKAWFEWDTCVNGMIQSPINLDTTKATVHAPIQFRNYFNGNFNKHFKGAMINNGITVVWNINPNHHFKLRGGKLWKWHNPSIRDGPFGGLTHTYTYYLWKAEFHWGEPGVAEKGSEHTINGKQFPLEMQMVHIEDSFVERDGSLKYTKARHAKHGFAILSILFKIDPNKPQNQEPLSQVDDKVWGMHWPGAHAKRSLDMDLNEVEEEVMERDHELNMRQLQYGFSQLKANENARETRAAHMKRIKLTLNVGAFIRKVVRNGAHKTMSTYWTYKGSLTIPPCNEAVTWVVFQRVLPIAQVQANAFSSLYTNNWRPTMKVSVEHNVQHLIHNCLNCECKCHK